MGEGERESCEYFCGGKWREIVRVYKEEEREGFFWPNRKGRVDARKMGKGDDSRGVHCMRKSSVVGINNIFKL